MRQRQRFRFRCGSLLLCGLLVACAAQRAPVDTRESNPAARTLPVSRETAARVHVVERGDTLFAIAWRYETTVEALARRNGLGPPYLIRVGQQLRVDDPGRAPTAATPVAAAVTQPQLTTDTGTTVHAAASPKASATVAPTPPAPPQLPTRAGIQPPPPPAGTSAPTLASAQPPAPLPTAAADRSWRWPVEGKFTRAYDSNRQFKGINIQSRSGVRVLAAAPGAVVYAGDGLRGYGQLIIVKHDEVYLSAYAHNRVMKVREGDRVAGGQDIGEVGGDAANPGRLYFEIRKEGKPIDPTRLLPAQ